MEKVSSATKCVYRELINFAATGYTIIFYTCSPMQRILNEKSFAQRRGLLFLMKINTLLRMKVMIHFHFGSFSLSPTTTKWLTCFHFCFWSFCVVQEIATFILLPRRRRRSQKLFELLFPRIIIQSETETFSLADSF